MKLFRRWWTGRHNGDGEGPDAVLSLLIDAVARNDGKRFGSLCRQHAQAILDHFVDWRRVPEGIRDDLEKVGRRATTLMRIAQAFEQAGHPELMALLVGDLENNPVMQWDRALVDMKRSANAGDPQDGLAAVSAFLMSLQASGVSGPGFLSARAKARGLQASLLVKMGRDAEAQEATEAALADCEQAGDVEGVDVYRRNLTTLDSHQPTLPGDIDLEIEILEQMRLAQRRTDLRRYHASNAVLEKLLASAGEAAPILQRLRPHLLGRIGFNEFKLGHLDTARQRVTAARDACLAAHDDEGAEVYAENLTTMTNAAASRSSARDSDVGS